MNDTIGRADGSILNDSEMNDSEFTVGSLLEKVESYARSNGFADTLKAIEIMKKYHSGACRKGPEKAAYIVHPLTLAAQAISLGIGDDIVISACLLHDVLEDSDATADDLNVNADIIEAVELVSFDENTASTKEEAKRIYFEKIAENPIASIVKVLDRCNNISNMSKAFSCEKMKNYLEETYRYILPLIDKLEAAYADRNGAWFAVKYHMLAVLETIGVFVYNC